jgi:hypothetical protein
MHGVASDLDAVAAPSTAAVGTRQQQPQQQQRSQQRQQPQQQQQQQQQQQPRRHDQQHPPEQHPQPAAAPQHHSAAATALLDLAAGTAAGTAQLLVGHPFDTIKVKLQSQALSNAQVAGSAQYRGPLDAARTTVTKEGLRGLYRGMAAPLATVALFNAVLFSSRGQAQALLARADGAASRVFCVCVCVCACMARTVICCSNGVRSSRRPAEDAAPGFTHPGHPQPRRRNNPQKPQAAPSP